jgi:hypothetical protein
MIYEGNLRKMRTSLNEQGMAEYKMVLYDNLNPIHEVPLNKWVGKPIRLHFEGQINCVVTGKQIKKTYGEGMCWDAFKESPLAVPSIIKPELSQAHLGIGLRDLDWEIEHHVKPHYVYLSKTSGIKVGVTRTTQKPYRWIDQGAVEAIILAETPYRQAAGLIEVSLKKYMADKTNWRKMLTNVIITDKTLLETKELVLDKIPADLQQYISDDDTITKIEYPVSRYPEKVRSLKFDKEPDIQKILMGIKGQYLIFDDQSVLNIRSHSGYKISLKL